MPTLDWLNRDAAFQIAAGVPYRLLEEVSAHEASAPTLKAPPHKGSEGEKAESRQDLFSGLEPTSDKGSSEKLNVKAATQNSPATTIAPTRDNLLIQGDNLEALKALLPLYRGQVKCIFIDPPYNTKSAFEHYDDNLEHAQWLTMMLPRLQLLRELLSEDGSIWVTIDDNEGHYLKVLMDEVFGRGNFVGTAVWQKKYAPKSDSKYLSESHDFVLGYARKLDVLSLNRIVKGERQTARYTNRDNDPRGPWKASDVLRSESRDYAIYAVTLPSGKEVWPPPGTSWRYTREKFAELIADNRIWFGLDGNARPAYKRFLSEVTDSMPATTIWSFDEVGHNDESKKEMRALFGEELFGTPKPERLLQRILHIASNPNDLILDSFLGSGTTAAVAQKMGRRWIGIEMGEHARTHCLPRLQKVLDGEQGGISKAVNWQGGGSFRFLRLGAPVFDEAGAIHPDVRFSTLAAFVWMQETGTPLATGQAGSSPFLGTHNGVDYFLLFNGILGDKRPNAGNVLTRAVLLALTTEFPANGRPRVIYGESNRLGEERLKEALVQFKSIPHEVVVR
jgi:adenine-specific DNA-methyltransferase